MTDSHVFPTSLDSATTLPSVASGTDNLNAAANKQHDTKHNTEDGAIIALETKVGTGASTPTAGRLLVGDGTGSSSWLAKGTAGQRLVMNAGATAPAWESGIADQLVADASINNSVTKTALYTKSVAGGTLSTNRALRLTLIGSYLNNSGSTATVAWEISYGGVVFALRTATNMTTSANPRGFKIEAILFAHGATNAQRGGASELIGLAGSAGAPPSAAAGFESANVSSNSAMAVDSTAAQDIIFSLTHGTAHANITGTVLAAVLELL